MKVVNKIAAVAALILSCSGISSAREIIPLTDIINEPIVIGAGLALAPDYIGSNDYMLSPFAFGKYTFPGSKRYVKFSGLEVALNVLDIPNLSAGPLINVHGSRDDGVNDEVVKKMRKIKMGLDAGAFISYDFKEKNPRNKLNMNVQFLADTSGEINGYIFDFDVNYWKQVTNQIDCFVGTGTTTGDKKVMNTLFGVNSDNRGSATAAELPDYEAGSGFRDVNAYIGTLYYHNKNWLFGGVVRYQRLLGDVADSPLVDSRGSANQMITALFASYLW